MTSAIVKLNDIPVVQPGERPAEIAELAGNPTSTETGSPVVASRGVLIGILLGAAMWVIILALAVPHLVG